MWIKPIRLEFKEHELRKLRGLVSEELSIQERCLRTFKPKTAMYAGVQLMCDELTRLKTKLSKALGSIQ